MLVASAFTPAAVVSPATLVLSEFMAVVSAVISDVSEDLSASVRCLAAVTAALSLDRAASRRSIRAITAALSAGRSSGAAEKAGDDTSSTPAMAVRAVRAVVRMRRMVSLSVGVGRCGVGGGEVGVDVLEQPVDLTQVVVRGGRIVRGGSRGRVVRHGGAGVGDRARGVPVAQPVGPAAAARQHGGQGQAGRGQRQDLARTQVSESHVSTFAANG